MTNFILDHGTLAIAKYLKIIYIYAVLDKKDQCEESLVNFAQELMIPKDSFKYVLDFSKLELFNHICDFAREVTWFDRMFSIIFSNIDVNYKDLVLTQRIPVDKNLRNLKYGNTYGSIININYSHLVLNGLVIFIYICKKLNVKSSTILSACGSLLLKPYFDVKVIYELGYSELNEFLVYEDLNSEQLYLCRSFEKEATNPVFMLPTCKNLDPIDLNLFQDISQDLSFMRKIGEALFMDYYKDSPIKYFPWLFSKLWVSNPEQFSLMIDAKLPDIGVFDIQTTLEIPCNRSLRKFIPNILDSVYNNIELDKILEAYLNFYFGEGTSFFFDASEYNSEKTNLYYNYSLLCYTQLLRMAKVYLKHIFGCSYKDVQDFCTIDFDNLLNIDEQTFKKKPSTKQLAELLVMCEGSNLESSDLFIIVNMINRIFANNIMQWFEFTKFSTGFNDAKIHKLTDEGFLVLNIDFSDKSSLGIAKKLRNDFVNFEDIYLINIESDRIADWPLDLMLQGLPVSCTNVSIEDLPKQNGVEFEKLKMFLNPEDLSVYPFDCNGDFVYQLCNLPYNISLDAENQEVTVADKVYKYSNSDSSFVLLEKRESNTLTSLFN